MIASPDSPWAVSPRSLKPAPSVVARQGKPATRLRRRAARAIWIVGAQKVVPDLSTALRRVEEHCLPLESARAQVAYGQPSAVNRLRSHAEPHPGRGTVLLLREAIGF